VILLKNHFFLRGEKKLRRDGFFSLRIGTLNFFVTGLREGYSVLSPISL